MDGIAQPPDPDALAEALETEVFAPGETPGHGVYLLLDAARDPEIAVCAEALSDGALCLFDGEAGENLAEVAPWLVPVTSGDDAMDWFLAEGFGRDWGILLAAPGGARRVKTTLKRILMVEDERGEAYFFKFYRPRNFNTYIPMLDHAQALYVMRGLSTVWAEDADAPATLIRYDATPRGVTRHAVPLLPGAGR